MNDLSQIFEYPLSTHAFIIGNALFAVLAIGAVAFIRANTQSNARVSPSRGWRR